MTGADALAALWRLAGLPGEALGHACLLGAEPVYPSSFAVGTAAQSTIAAAALAACELAHLRGTPRQRLQVDMAHAAAECLGWYRLDGQVTDPWDPFSGLYRTRDGWVRVHANFRHHRDGALRLLGLDPASADRAAAQQVLLGWDAVAFESAAAEAGLVAAALRSFDEWDRSLPGQAIAAQPLMRFTQVGDADPIGLGPLDPGEPPLTGVRVLDLTRILAGPVGGRALAAYGADVMLVNAPHLPNIDAIADTSRGKRSAHVDLRSAEGHAAMKSLAAGAHVFVQGYRPGALEQLGWGPETLASRRPGIVYVSLSAYGTRGPWAGRRGFDSLVQTAMGFNRAEGEAAGDAGQPRALPMQILDQATGYLIAFGAAAALWRQRREGGSWHVEVSLAQTGHWLRGLGRIADGFAVPPPRLDRWIEAWDSGFGRLEALRHSAELSRTPAAWRLPSVPPGTSQPHW